MTARKFAQDTDVPAERTQNEIKRLVEQYGASGFLQGWQGTRAGVIFEMHDRRIRFMMTLPDEADAAYTTWVRVSPTKERPRTTAERRAAWEQDVRSLWRALFLTIKAKLVSVERGVEQFEEAFASQIVMSNDQTVGEWLVPQIGEMYRTRTMPPLLPGVQYSRAAGPRVLPQIREEHS